MPKVISHPGKYSEEQAQNVEFQHSEQPFGYFETQGPRSSQEDTLAWETLEQLDSLSPEDIGKQLSATYQALDEHVLKNDYDDGTTAVTTVYDGKGNFITAILADAASFAAIYDKEDKVLGVVRLNSVTHKPTDPEEEKRINSVGGYVYFSRVNGILAVSRAIGDKSLKKFGICSEATIDITNIDKLADHVNIHRDDIGKIQIIVTCDGFTDGAEKQTKKGHEDFLYANLEEIVKSNNKKSETEIARFLVDQVIKSGRSRDNVTVAIQTITKDTKAAFLIGVYDGHGGANASTYVAENIGTEFNKQCALTPELYKEQPINAEVRDYFFKNQTEVKSEVYEPIITQLRLITQEYQNNLSKKNLDIHTIIGQLLTALDSSEPNQKKIETYYKILETKENGRALNNLEIIQNNKAPWTKRFIARIAELATILINGILSGLATIGVMPVLTRQTAEGLFKIKAHDENDTFRDSVVQVKEQLSSSDYENKGKFTP
ncbi:MAG: PP2C family serine/threonine-protein phosphatase [Legionella sp.]|uniref:PP2C family serine/threonine-protein phosphatase n=1 Tax=Legionella sp. TaxID=459 RepID=UPI0039E5750D